MVCALGLADCLVGITHCCDYPPEIRNKPVVVHSNLPEGDLSLSEIDRAVADTLHRGESLYQVDEELLRELAPTHILTQDLCEVCAPSGNEVTRALKSLRVRPQVLWMSPHSIADIHSNLRELGRTTGREAQAEHLIEEGRNRFAALASGITHACHRPRVFCAEWLDPLFCAGHWTPELVELAGGIDVLGRKWADSVRVEWNEVRAAAPDILVLMPCGFGSRCAQQQAATLVRQPGWAELPAVLNNRVFAVDGAYFNRPGPRVVQGAELLAHLLHPKAFDWTGPPEAFVKIDFLATSERNECERCSCHHQERLSKQASHVPA